MMASNKGNHLPGTLKPSEDPEVQAKREKSRLQTSKSRLWRSALKSCEGLKRRQNGDVLLVFLDYEFNSVRYYGTGELIEKFVAGQSLTDNETPPAKGNYSDFQLKVAQRKMTPDKHSITPGVKRKLDEEQENLPISEDTRTTSVRRQLHRSCAKKTPGESREDATSDSDQESITDESEGVDRVQGNQARGQTTARGRGRRKGRGAKGLKDRRIEEGEKEPSDVSVSEETTNGLHRSCAKKTPGESREDATSDSDQESITNENEGVDRVQGNQARGQTTAFGRGRRNGRGAKGLKYRRTAEGEKEPSDDSVSEETTNCSLTTSKLPSMSTCLPSECLPGSEEEVEEQPGVAGGTYWSLLQERLEPGDFVLVNVHSRPHKELPILRTLPFVAEIESVNEDTISVHFLKRSRQKGLWTNSSTGDRTDVPLTDIVTQLEHSETITYGSTCLLKFEGIE